MAIADTINSFFGLVQTGGSQDIPSIQALFVSDSAGPPPVPNIGLTTGGPQFKYQSGIADLFNTLDKTFSSWVFDPASNPPLQMTSGSRVAVEATLTLGSVMNTWAPTTVPATPPLSVIEPAQGNGSKLPVCAVFTMDPNTTRIMNLALYFDRWKLGQDLWDKAHPAHIDK